VAFEAKRFVDALRQGAEGAGGAEDSSESARSPVRFLGGAANAPAWRELVRSVIGAVTVYDNPNVALMGAAALGGVAMGVWPNLAEASRALCPGTVLPPSEKLAGYYADKFGRYLEGCAQ